MKRFVVLLLATPLLGLSGCATLPASEREFQKTPTSVQPSTAFKLDQVEVFSPREDTWSVAQYDPHLVIFARLRDGKIQATEMRVKMSRAPAAKTSRKFLEGISAEREKVSDSNRFKLVRSKTEYVTFLQLPCLKYNQILEDHDENGISSSRFQYAKFSGFICRYPETDIALQMEVSDTSAEKELAPDLKKSAQDFFTSLKLAESALQNLKSIP